MTAQLCLALFVASTIAVSAATSSIDPELARQEQETERLLRQAEAEFWSLKRKIERERTDREQRLVAARADYERALAIVDTLQAAEGSAERELAIYRADEALEKYQVALEQAMGSVDAARTELERIEERVSQYRAALEALRRRSQPTQQPTRG